MFDSWTNIWCSIYIPVVLLRVKSLYLCKSVLQFYICLLQHFQTVNLPVVIVFYLLSIAEISLVCSSAALWLQALILWVALHFCKKTTESKLFIYLCLFSFLIILVCKFVFRLRRDCQFANCYHLLNTFGAGILTIFSSAALWLQALPRWLALLFCKKMTLYQKKAHFHVMFDFLW